MLAKLARQIGESLARSLNLPSEAADRAAFALENLFQTTLTFVTIVLAGWLTGLFWPVMIASLSGAILRRFSGGAHLGTPWRCIVFSTFLSLCLGFAGRSLGSLLPRAYWPILTSLVMIPCFIQVSRYAPAETPAKPLTHGQRIILRNLSIIVLVLFTTAVLLQPAGRDLLGGVLCGAAWQILSITPAGFRFYDFIDKLGAKGGERECANCS